MNRYNCLNINELESGDYKIIPVRKKDIMIIKEWRNKQIKILRQKEMLTERKQKDYFEKIIFPSFKYEKPNQILFSFLFKNRLIGYGGLVHINWGDKKGEVSFLLNPSRVKNILFYKNDFTVFLEFIKKIAYGDLKFNRLFTETFDLRRTHVKVLEKNNFKLEGRLKKHVCINNKFVDSLIHGNLNEYEKI